MAVEGIFAGFVNGWYITAVFAVLGKRAIGFNVGCWVRVCLWKSSGADLNKFYMFKRKNPPPSPKRLPITGNFDQLGSAPHRSLQSLARKHGPIMLQQLGGVPVIVASSADLAREIMRTHDLVFSNRPKSSITFRLMYESKDKHKRTQDFFE
ncbi:hypothetical protein LguiB_006150 [Lonicera macranthoides]